eukprot:4573912-Pyramimonas_sp.AAC.1
MTIISAGLCLCKFCGYYWPWKGCKKHTRHCGRQGPAARIRKAKIRGQAQQELREQHNIPEASRGVEGFFEVPAGFPRQQHRRLRGKQPRPPMPAQPVQPAQSASSSTSAAAAAPLCASGAPAAMLRCPAAAVPPVSPCS